MAQLDPAAAANANRGGLPTEEQRVYLQRGLSQPGGKLPLFDKNGQEVDGETVRSCIAQGWAEPWFINPIKPDWLVAKLTKSGFEVLGATPPHS